jgi:hypothetical protein
MFSAIAPKSFISQSFITPFETKAKTLEKLPFDSLYKFLVGAGVALFIGCLAMLLNEEKSLAGEKAEQSAQQAVQNVHLRANSKRAEELRERGASGPAVLKELEDIIKDNGKWIAESGATTIAAAKTDARELVYGRLYWLLVGGIVAGAVLIVSALSLWFFKLQRHIDKQVKLGRFPSGA